MGISENIIKLKEELPDGVELVAVSKTYPPEDILKAYDAGQRVFGESRPQEMKAKREQLPEDIRWHMIGHLQTNKVKYIAPFVDLVHSVDSDRLLAEIDRQAARCGRKIDVLLEVHIAREESKHGWDAEELKAYIAGGGTAAYGNVRIRGLMGIATFTEDTEAVRGEFTRLRELYDGLRAGGFGPEFDTLSMGMTGDYRTAIECGSTMVRIGSMIFGERDYA
ncbi:MAG: YggS family pyridoxal phosphate-dependent enzyme [Rikenellaceae bacterium]|nr:YggS family pyridoxal phosphate-dependent enzyme [Rikenellaceae bacterium]